MKSEVITARAPSKGLWQKSGLGGGEEDRG